MTAKSKMESLWEDKVLPENVKKNVLESIETIQLIADIADLFTIKKFQAGGAILGAMADSFAGQTEKKEEPDDKKESSR